MILQLATQFFAWLIFFFHFPVYFGIASSADSQYTHHTKKTHPVRFSKKCLHTGFAEVTNAQPCFPPRLLSTPGQVCVTKRIMFWRLTLCFPVAKGAGTRSATLGESGRWHLERGKDEPVNKEV